MLPDAVPFRARSSSDRGLLLALLLLPLAIALAAAIVFQHSRPDVSNLTGATAVSLIHGRGLTACTEFMGTPGNPICFHGARMPVPSVVVAAGLLFFGPDTLPVTLFKTVLFLIPVAACIVLVWSRLPAVRTSRLPIALLLLSPFATLPFLADVVNIQVEEAYTYSFLALATALLFCTDDARSPRSTAFLMAFSIDAIYLAKSSMLPVACVLTVAYFVRERRAAPRALLLLLTLAAPLGWAIRQHHASGRYTLGTSLDGMNLHKGNNPAFLARYPPPPGSTLDQFDAELNAGHTFPDEWAFNDFHQRAALDFILGHPGEALRAAARKFHVLFFALTKYGSGQPHGLRLVAETAGIVIFRLLLWTAILASVFGLLYRLSWSGTGAIFLCLVAACALPYVLGFAYMRHASVLIYPSVLMCCVLLLDRPASASPQT